MASMILPMKEVSFSANFLLPEAVFIALSAPELYRWSSKYYGKRTKKQDEWIDLIERYNDWVMEDTDEDFDWFE